MVHFWGRNGNPRLAEQTELVADTVTVKEKVVAGERHTAVVVSLVVQLGQLSPVPSRLTLWGALGILVWGVGFGFEAVAWYWHFVDVVWLGLFIFVYVY